MSAGQGAVQSVHVITECKHENKIVRPVESNTSDNVTKLKDRLNTDMWNSIEIEKITDSLETSVQDCSKGERSPEHPDNSFSNVQLGEQLKIFSEATVGSKKQLADCSEKNVGCQKEIKNCSLEIDEQLSNGGTESVVVEEQSPDCYHTDSVVIVNRVGAVTMKVPVTVNGHKVDAIVDTGAAVSVISQHTFFSISENELPELRQTNECLVVAEKGKTMKTYGVADISLCIGGHSLTCPVFVAPICDDFLLGGDIIHQENITVNMRKGLKLRGKWIKCKVDTQDGIVGKVSLNCNITIPSASEYVASATVENTCTTTEKNRCVLIEPTFSDNRKFKIARVLVQPVNNQVPIRLVNLSFSPINLKKHYIIGKTVEIDESDISGNNTECPPEKCTDSIDSFKCKINQVKSNRKVCDLPDHVKELYEKNVAALPNDELKAEFADIISEFSDVFAKDSTDVGSCSVLKHKFDTGKAHPTKQGLRRTPREFEGEEKKYLQDQLDAGVIVPSSSAWSSPVCLVRKKDGTVRWCVDYRKLNDVTIKDAYPLPRIDMCLEHLQSAKYFSTLDLQSGYWQIEVDSKDREKTAFITKYGLFEYNKMPFGVCNGPSTFQRCMELVLKGLQWETLLIYLDDVILYSSTLGEHLKQIRIVLSRFLKANLKLKPSKCHFFQEEVLFLGHIVSGDGVKPNPELIKAVNEWQPPTSVKEIQKFLGLCNYYRQYVQGFATIAHPLTNLTKKDVRYKWTDECQNAFETLKSKLCEAPILAYPQNDSMFILDTDASNYGVGCVLSQIQNDQEKVIAYSSKSLSKQQRRYCVTKRELLAVVVFLTKFRHYLLGREFLIRTDHSSLRWLCGFKDPQHQLARWLEVISEYNYKIIHRSGNKHGNADSLSRQMSDDEILTCECYGNGVPVNDLPCGGCKKCTKINDEWSTFFEDVDTTIPLGVRNNCRRMNTRSRTCENAANPVNNNIQAESAQQLHTWFEGYSSQEINKLQKEDSDLGILHIWNEEGNKPDAQKISKYSPAIRKYWLNWDNLIWKDGMLYQKWISTQDNISSKLQLLVPKCLRKEALHSCHDILMSGHLGMNKTIKKIKGKFYWYLIGRDIKMHIKSCTDCSKNKMPRKKSKAPLVEYQVGFPMDRIAIDLMGPLVTTKHGNKYILVIGDYFTRWVEAFPLPDIKAETVAQCLLNEFIARLGIPLELHSDQATNFESNLFQELCKSLEIKKTRTTPYHPSSNGMIERFNRTLVEMLRKYVNNKGSNWDGYVKMLTSAYRSTVHPATGFTPNMMMLGREINLPSDLLFPLPDKPKFSSPVEYVSEQIEEISKCFEQARKGLKSNMEYQKKNYDVRLAENKYNVGDLVFKLKPRQRKLDPFWTGPFVVSAVIGQVLYKIVNMKRAQVVHHNLLKPYQCGYVPKWVHRMRKTMNS